MNAAYNIFDIFKKFKPQNSTLVESQEHELIEKAKTVDKYLSADGSFIFVWSMLKEEFVYVGEGVTSMLGYSPSDYVNENGMSFTLSNMHEDHAKGYLSLYKTMQEFFIKNEISADADYLSSYNMLYKGLDGNYIQFLQTNNSVIVDEAGMPLLSLSIARDITHLKKSVSMDLIIASPNNQKRWSYNSNLNIMEEVSTLTKQEKKILNLLQTGLDTKDVANLCNSSTHTINTHRKNILEKTNCVNTTAAITYCKLVGLL